MTRIKHKPGIQDLGYQNFAQINGLHPLQEQVPFAYVSYQVRRRKAGKVTFFNFALAKEMGLLDSQHPHEMNKDLQETLLDTFGLIIVNEYDLLHAKRIESHELKPHRYMATRYLQMQHADRRGLSSGDGRSIWNGTCTSAGRSWDISSCGTGATCLSPATSQKKTFIRSGDPSVSYGCGYSKLHEGLVNVLFSEILHRNALKTERVLCVIEFPKGFAISVRAAENLLRPSHFFLHLKQGRLDRLKALVDYHIQRQLSNGSWSLIPGLSPYRLFLKSMIQNFAHAAAQFEAEYIFCWMEWDGDNILADAGIIDYGSVRQFGLYYHEYRFDDHERWSTNLKQQRNKARYMVQTFVQMIDFIESGAKKPIESFAQALELDEFDRIYLESRQRFFLRRLGFDALQSQYACQRQGRLLKKLMASFSILEHAKASGGRVRVPDGENIQVLFSMRKLLRLLPEKILHQQLPLAAHELLQEITAQAAKKDSRAQQARYRKEAAKLQGLYSKLLQRTAAARGTAPEVFSRQLFHRSALINRDNRVTGDAIVVLAEQLLKQRLRLSSRQFHQLLEEIISDQVLNPDYQATPFFEAKRAEMALQGLVRHAMKVVSSYREGL